MRVGGSRVERCRVRGSQVPGPGEYRACVEGSAAFIGLMTDSLYPLGGTPTL